MRSPHVILIAATILLASVPGAALAQPVAQDPQQARQFFDQAEVHKRQGDEHAARGEQDAAREAYGKAAEAYTKAFELYEHPAFIYNLAQMRRLRGERQRAIRAYETFLVLAPSDQLAVMARTFIAQLTVELDAEASKTEATSPEPASGTEPAPVTPPEPAPAVGTGPETTAIDRASPPPASTSLEVSDTRTDPSRGKSLRVAGMVSMAAGALGVGLGIKFGLDARAASRELENQDMGEPWDKELFARGEAAERNMIIAFGAGGAAVIAGGVMYVLGVATSENQPLAVRPSATPDGFAVHLSGTF